MFVPDVEAAIPLDQELAGTGEVQRFAFVIDDRRVLALRGRLTCQQVADLVTTCQPAVVAIDGPRSCAPEGQTARAGEIQLARAICGIRWTPDARHVHGSPYYAWVLEGLALFGALSGSGPEVIEVFPTASCTR